QFHLRGTFDAQKISLKPAILGQGPQPAQLAEIAPPFATDRLADRLRQRGVREFKPSAWSHSVRFVVEALRKELGQVSHRRAAQQLGVYLGDAIGAVRGDDRKVRHEELVGRTLRL